MRNGHGRPEQVAAGADPLANRVAAMEDHLEVEVRTAGQAMQTWSLAGMAAVRLAYMRWTMYRVFRSGSRSENIGGTPG